MIKHLHCFFAVIIENESALKMAQNRTLSSVTMSDTNWSLKERCTTDDMSTVSVRVSVILLFLTRYSKEFEKKSYS